VSRELASAAWVVLAGLATAAVLAMWLRWGRWLPMDVANGRSLHAGAVPRVGGAAMAVGCLAASIGLATRWAWPGPLVVIFGAAGVLVLLSLLDDWRSLPVAPRLAGHLAAALAVMVVLDLPLLPALPLFLALAWMTNLYNFMDGADGLAGGMALIGFGCYGVAALDSAPALAWSCFVPAAAAAGFLVFNLPPARVFMGDAGSVPLGFLSGALGLYGWQTGVWPLWFPVLVFLPFVGDATVTLWRRLLRGERVWEAHREHCYQRLVRLGWSHRRLALVAGSAMMAAAASALVLREQSTMLQVAGLVAWGGAVAAALVRVDRLWRKTAGLPGCSGE
jgi:UDP-N-acetylmuramyl pentapeptide phosphotransferase/UDP-N-acetylglucosamine-1-phosphate transferase